MNEQILNKPKTNKIIKPLNVSLGIKIAMAVTISKPARPK
jgi:hypothetical protein